MPAVRYIRIRKGFKRTLRVKDLEQLGIPHEGQPLSWGVHNGFTIVMSKEMSDSLVAKLPNEFIALPVKGEDESPSTDSVDDSESDDPQESVVDSEGDPEDDDESSTGDDDPDE
jgi:hypothetical protein